MDGLRLIPGKRRIAEVRIAPFLGRAVPIRVGFKERKLFWLAARQIGKHMR